MRTITECVEDIKSILNNVERTQEYTGETSVDINEFVDEILSINTIHEKQATATKPIAYKNKEYKSITYCCPKCEREILYMNEYNSSGYKEKYCMECGQHIHWKNERHCARDWEWNWV